MVLSSGPAVHSVEVPFVGPDFQTNIAGVYIVGELGGRGLIKNAINEGKLVIEGIHRQVEGNGGGPEMLDVLIVGSGPAGLSAGLEAQRSGLRYRILEQGSLGDSIRRYPRHKLLLAEPVRVPLYGDLWVADATKETLLKVWETIAANTGLEIRTGHKVENVVRKDGFFALECGNGTIHAARRVVLALGRRGTPRRLQVPGEELPKVIYDVSEMEIFRGRRILVVGGGESAAESALGLAGQMDAEVTLSYRGSAIQRVGPRNAEKLETAVGAGRIRLMLGSQVRAIQSERVTLATAGGEVAVPNDDVVVRIGGDPPARFLERVGVRIVSKDLPLPSAGAERRA
jgi:thioredoxin reductase